MSQRRPVAACWALLTIPDQPAGTALDQDADEDDDVVDLALPTVDLFRPEYDATAASDEVSQRGLPGDVYRAATIRTGRLVT